MVSERWRAGLAREYSTATASGTVERLTGTDWTSVDPHLGQEEIGVADVM